MLRTQPHQLEGLQVRVHGILDDGLIDVPGGLSRLPSEDEFLSEGLVHS